MVAQVAAQALERTMAQAVVVAPIAPVSSDTTDVEAMRAQILALYNQARIAEGIAPLAPNWALQQAAQLHAEDCALRGFGSHTGSDGANTPTRVGRAGYSGRITGENWAWRAQQSASSRCGYAGIPGWPTPPQYFERTLRRSGFWYCAQQRRLLLHRRLWRAVRRFNRRTT
ncbi:MAG: CAP domain-containing protein [Anaerolineae bacterium]|nr:CAP domain-containing protein [Anaerolineae bacterium]